MTQYQIYQDFINNQTTQDLATPFCYASSVVPLFTPLVLIGLFLIVFLSTFFGKKRQTGRGDIGGSFFAGGLMVAVSATVMCLTSCPLIDGYTLIASICIGIVGIIVLFTTRESGY